MTATERLRELLDERGVEWEDYSDDRVAHTSWNNLSCWFNEFPDGWTAWGMSKHGTPEQAIAATLGDNGAARSNNGVTAEQVRRCVRVGACDHGIWGAIDEDTDWQGIADELNATLGAGTCRMIYDEEASGDELWPTEAFNCSECGKWVYAGKPNFCPTCGKKVEQ